MIRRLLRRRRFMREHRWTHARLNDYLDDDLSIQELRRVEEHLSLCPECRRIMRTLRRTLEELMSLHSAAPPHLTESIIDRLRREG